LEKVLEVAQVGEEYDHYEEWLHTFGQEAKKTTALKLTAEEEQVDVVLTPWEMALEMLEDWLNNPEQAEDHFEESLKDFSQGDELVKTAVPRYAVDDEEKFQVEEQLGEARIQPAGELAKEEVEQQFSEETTEMKFAAE
jgi:hypothetical protein